MIVICASEPGSWLEPTLAHYATRGPLTLVAPWMPRGAAERLPHRVVRLPGFAALRLARRIYSGDRVERQMRFRFAYRMAFDRAVARWLPASTREVVCQSLAARTTLATAAERDVHRTLVEDLPALRGIHEDLDDAARALPGLPFLKRYRAPHSVVVRQESEWLLADTRRVRGHFAAAYRHDQGLCADVLDPPSLRVRSIVRRPAHDRPRLLLAGLATGRNGVVAAVHAAEAVGAELLARGGPGAEPPHLLARPHVRTAHGRVASLDGVDAVLAPAWCESYAPEVTAATRAGIPVIATRRGAGPVVADVLVPRGDAIALAAAIRDTLAVSGRRFAAQ